MIERRDARAPLRLDHRGRIRLGDDRRAIDALPRGQLLAPIERCLLPFARGKHVHGLYRRRGLLAPGRLLLRRVARCDRLDRHRFGHQRPPGHEEGELLAVRRLELRHHLRQRPERHDERGVGAVVFEVHAPLDLHRGGRHALQLELLARGAGELLGDIRQVGRVIELQLHRALAHRGLVGESHAVGREHAGMRMDERPRHAERIGHQARMLARRAAEAAQRIARHVVPALHGDVLDRVRHVADRDLHEAFGDFLRAASIADLAR